MSEEKSKEKSLLNKEISLGKKAPKWPSKKSINFIYDGQAKTDRTAIVLFIIFICALIPFTYFGVIQMIHKVNVAAGQYNQVKKQLDEVNVTIQDYDEVKDKYDDIVGSYLTEDEKACLNRTDILKMIEEDILPSASVKSISVHGNQVTVDTDVTTLSTVSSMIVKLQGDTRNQYVTVTTTSASSQDGNSVIAMFEITYGSETTLGGAQ